MTLVEALELYKVYSGEGTFKAYKGKFSKFVRLVGNVGLSEAFEINRLKEYIFDGQQKAVGKYYALRSLFEFSRTLYAFTEEDFPIDRHEVEEFDKGIADDSENHGETNNSPVFLDRNFDINTLFLNDHFDHLNSREAILVSKAAIALGVSAGYDSGEMFYNKTVPKMKIDDIQVFENCVKVKNYTKMSKVKHIFIYGDLAKYIKEYYELRKLYNDLPKFEHNFFFSKIWSSRDLEYDATVEMIKRKPYRVNELVYYVLKYISRKMNFPKPLKVTDLRYNLVLHSLYRSNGSTLFPLIRTFGFQPFVQEAIARYCNDTQFNEEYSFHNLVMETPHG